MNIQIHRIYDGDRLCPRGISKDEASLDEHWKDLAPSNDLRKWFDHDPDKWGDFRIKYLSELSQNREEAKKYLEEVNQNIKQ